MPAAKKPTSKTTVKAKTPTPKKAAQPAKPDINFKGKGDLASIIGVAVKEVSPMVQKFQLRFNCELVFVPKFFAFKCMRDGNHVDWIHYNDLLLRYDSKLPEVTKRQGLPQRPTEKKRIY